MSVYKQDIKLYREIKPRNGHFDSTDITIFSTLLINEGILLFYYVKNPFLLGAALLDLQDSETVLWRSSNPIWETREKIKPLSIFKKSKKIHFNYESKKISHSVQLSLNNILTSHRKNNFTVLKRIAENPILKPNQKNTWEASAVFNSAAHYLDNQVHFVYRAITTTGESLFGYAASNDGMNITTRHEKPVYFLSNTIKSKKKPFDKLHLSYMSGNNWRGCEDPRLSKIGGRIYMTYTAWNNASPPHVALTSIKVSDFLKKQWNWTTPIQISQNNELHKNWVVFPEKIKGKYAILHSLSPHILIEYIDSLGNRKKPIASYYHPDRRELYWDNWMRGSGPPPIKTNEGWLLLYHAMDRNDPNKYKIGAMILDLENPSKVLYRSSYPILEPDVYYENQGHKAGVVYTRYSALLRKT